jgi:very-short-patch-repair endonuclease
LDFYCSKLALAVELDGEIHKKTRQYDQERTTYLVNCGISVARYWNSDVLDTPDMVYKDLLEFMHELETKK